MVLYESKEIVRKITKELVEQFKVLTNELKRAPRLAIIQIGDHEASNKYIKYKLKKAIELGVEATHHKFPVDIRQKELLKKIDEINDIADGIIVQLPLPGDFATQVILDSVRLEKDIDGLSSKNEFNFYNDKDKSKFFHFTPATALAVKELIDYFQIPIKDKKVGVIGRSHLVGKPIAHLIKQMGGQVSTYSKKSTIKGVENADVIITGAGDPLMLKKQNLKEGSIVIDVGATYIEKDGKKILVGDLDTTNLDGHVQGFSPVPGGVGPLTVVSLFTNLVAAIKNQLKIY
ncbi:bifunctional 5,10-methylenetetrahydrofolate dehydrogenase/5,10-methenyltetrahydrofolate cyclohydrolase [Mycoplasmopsis columbina]|uniref:bifunctional 5,10-methylenetetrahydrofolate dehydrogenase/5,10-methenyltetrahydrofolate cyclohydrolase n=1 Tax=Mycoplasmopsis columbina TaxID=114881 RepID=UPI001004E5BF|nr:bifunctional 5,10-methylenetetrahydrofolate dehydrogenase/5,10-methenyltetrahydrofolate cyclohydrolase [Mycoplasmopsis columbina]VEU77073.1 methylenetetrahydrofolate dehydrogenase (NADP+), methenyltetrahydrofolate cyclohydrolase [Mycoplasmopsis columbina]